MHVELAPENPARPKPWTAEQCRIFMRACAEDRLAPLYWLLMVTGLRRGEAIGLRWVDVDLDARCLFVVQQITEIRGQAVVGTPKTKRGTRLVPIDGTTVAVLTAHAEAQRRERAAWGLPRDTESLVFTREDGAVLRPEYVTKHFQSLTRKAGLPVIRLHDLRHTNATLALSAGVDMKVVSERLGHSTTAITADLYTHVDRGVGRAAADRIAGLLKADVDEMLTPTVGDASTVPENASSGRGTNEAPERVSAAQGPDP